MLDSFGLYSLRLICELVKAGADPTAMNMYTTILVTACAYNYREIVRLLLEYGADPTKQCSDGVSPLSMACSAGSTSTVCLLLEQKGIDVNIVGRRFMSPLMNACRRDRLRVVEHLVSLPHVNVDFRNCNNETAISCSIQTKNLDLVKAVLGRVKPTESDLQTACEYGTEEICKEIAPLLRA
ncbi:MAG: hypothetical protein A6F71_10330 [Cycloclasticus sp. symbiont of Poecilosclerida sp. M]|nr:MAG: hypothetical protein A6F71_10330 [Cycloclasticus sp. symbiont of Poecilosclerida sp. M]